MKSKSLQDLDAMRKKIADNAKVKELAEQARIAAEKRAEAERNLFTRAHFLPRQERAVALRHRRTIPKPAATVAAGAAAEGSATGSAGLAGNLLASTAKRRSSDLTSPMSMKKRTGR